MIVNRIKHRDKPNELAAYFTGSEFDATNTMLAEDGTVTHLRDLDGRMQRSCCYNILALIERDDRRRRIIDLAGGIRLDSEQLGHDLVERFMPEQDPHVFDPDYSPVTLTFRVLDEVGDQTFQEMQADPSSVDSKRIQSALSAAQLIVSFNITPPNLASV